MNLQKLVFLWLTGLLTCTSLMAQETVLASCGNATGSGGSTSYSVGQVAYTQQSSSSGNVSAGVQQAYEITVANSIASALSKSIDCKAYPNPTSDYLALEVEDFTLSTLHFQLYDMNGKFLQSEIITSNTSNIVMSNLVPASYFVKVVQGNKEVKTFKIIKK